MKSVPGGEEGTTSHATGFIQYRSILNNNLPHVQTVRIHGDFHSDDIPPYNKRLLTKNLMDSDEHYLKIIKLGNLHQDKFNFFQVYIIKKSPLST